MYPSPAAPNAVPGTHATCFCSSSFVQNSSDVMPNELMDGNT